MNKKAMGEAVNLRRAETPESPPRGGERSEPERGGAAAGGTPPALVREPGLLPDPEALEKPVRRRFTAQYKLGIVQEAEVCTRPGEVGALLRREGLYSSHLTNWRRQRDEGVLDALAPKKRGRKAVPPDPLAPRVAQLEREKRRLEKRLEQAETIIDIQKKVAALLGIPLKSPELGEDD